MDWEKYLIETTISGGYPSDGSGISGDDDLPLGTTVFGDKMVPVMVPNRLTGATKKYVTADELNVKWNYDEFDNSTGMGARQGYSLTLDSLKDILGDRLWKHTKEKEVELHIDKGAARADNDIDQDNKLSDDEEEVLDTPEMESDMEITEKINRWLGGDVEVESLMNESSISSADRKSLARVLMSGKNAKVSVKSLDIEAVVSNTDTEVVITYPKNDEFTMSLVDVADSLGMEFDQKKNGNKIIFKMVK